MALVSAGNWLFDWFAEREIQSLTQLRILLRDRRHRQSLIEAMGSAADRPLPPPSVASSHGIAAGNEIDLSGRGPSCLGSDCLIRTADTLFARSWHLFDAVVVVGPSARYIRTLAEGEILIGYQPPETTLDQTIESYFRLFLHLRDSKALRYMIFAEKPTKDDLSLVGAEEKRRIMEFRDEWIERVSSEASIRLLPSMGADPFTFDHWSDVTITHPEFFLNFGSQAVLRSEQQEPINVMRRLLREQFPYFADSLLIDMQYARLHGASLGSTSSVYSELDSANQLSRPGPSKLDVAFDIPMPFIEGLSTKNLIRLREDHASSFEVFRTALKTAITERVRALEAGESNGDVASQIAEDVIAPALADIENRLNAARSLLLRGGVVGLTAGTTIATVGLIASYPIANLIFGAILGLPDIRSYLNNRREIEASDMYYLWRISQKALHATKS